MNTLQNIYNKLSEEKTELASQKVELAGNIGDIEKALPKVLKDYETFKSLHNSTIKTANQAAKIGNTLTRLIDILDKDVAFIMTQAKNLGIDPKSIPVIKAYWDKMGSISQNYLETTTDAMETIK